MKRLFLLFGLSLVTAFHASAPAAETSSPLPALIPRKVLFGDPERTSPQLSPDGTRLAWLAPDGGVLNVWSRPLGADDKEATTVTADRKRGIRWFFWHGDSRQIMYGQDQDGDENWHVYQTDLAGRNTRDLTPFHGVQAQVISYDPRYPDRLLVGLNLRDRRLHDVYRVDLRNGALELDTPNPGDVSGWNVDNSGVVRIASVMRPDGGTELRHRPDDATPFTLFTRWSAEESFGGVAAFTPGNRGVYLKSSVGANTLRLLRVDLDTSATEVIYEDPRYDVGDLLRHPLLHTLEAVLVTRERNSWEKVQPAVAEDFAALRQVQEGDFTIASRDLADRRWIVAFHLSDGPTWFHLYDRETRRATPLFSNQPALEKYELAEMKPVSFRARDGLLLHGYLTLPPGVPSEKLPLVLAVHGGPWGRDTWGFRPVPQWLANRGYAVLQVNFRGSTGYGKEHLNAGDREWGGKMHTDLLDAKKWAVDQGYADPDRVAIMGGSYGGYAALAGAALTPGEFACAISAVGPSSLITLMQTIPPYWEPMRALFERRVGRLEEEEFLKSRSPLFHVDRISIPLLIAQGANDPRVKQAESDQIVHAMRAKNLPVEYLLFEDEGHGFVRPPNRLKYYAACESFLARHLGGRAEPATGEEDWAAVRR